MSTMAEALATMAVRKSGDGDSLMRVFEEQIRESLKTFAPELEPQIKITSAELAGHWYENEATDAEDAGVKFFFEKEHKCSPEEYLSKNGPKKFGHELVRSKLPEGRLRGKFKERFAHIHNQITKLGGYDGIVFVVDEFRSWQDRHPAGTPAYAEDEEVLETLAFILPTQHLNIITIIASQGDMPQKLSGGGEGDRFLPLYLLADKNKSDFGEIVTFRCRELLKGASTDIKDYYDYCRKEYKFIKQSNISLDSFASIFPFQPRCFDVMRRLTQNAKLYDPATDDYERPPFAADIKEGKNDPIYNAHSYHTKVPPRSIIPYILHYTKPGDLVLDVFCGSGMTGVAAQMCANPPADILEQFPELKDRIGPRACILNDLSPAACHIAYNYNTPIDVEALKGEFERIKAAVKDEFDWLYGTEHYEPAVDLYHLANAEVGSRLKNPPASDSMHTLLGGEERTWELLTKTEVEARLGYPVTELPRDERWGNTDVAKLEQWLSIPATIQYTIWSDVYRCEGFVTIEEPTGKVSTRGKNVGRPILSKKRVARGCGKSFDLWGVARNHETGEVSDSFLCPFCTSVWTKLQLKRVGAEPVVTNYLTTRLQSGKDGNKAARFRGDRRTTQAEKKRILDIENAKFPYWVPDSEMDRNGPQYRRSALNL